MTPSTKRYTVQPVPGTNGWTIADYGLPVPHAGVFGSAAAAVRGLEADPLGRFNETDEEAYVEAHADKLPVVTIEREGYKGAFKIEDGELLETVEFDLITGEPQWDQAAGCDPIRGESPELQSALWTAFAAMGVTR